MSGDLAPLDPVEVGDVLGADSDLDLLRLVSVVLTGVVVLKFDLSLTIFQSLSLFRSGISASQEHGNRKVGSVELRWCSRPDSVILGD